MNKKLYKSENDKILAGICGGIAEYLNIDSTIIRLLWILVVLLGGSGILLYIIAWVIVPSYQEGHVQTVETFDNGESKDDEGSERKAVSGNESSKNMGILLIIVGLIFLFTQLFHFYIPWFIVLPIVIIILGLYLIIKK